MYVCVLDLELPSTMGEVRCFLHKVAKARMKEAGARIPGTDQVGGIILHKGVEQWTCCYM